MLKIDGGDLIYFCVLRKVIVKLQLHFIDFYRRGTIYRFMGDFKPW